MTLKKDPKWLPIVMLGLGGLAMALRYLLYRLAVDEKGLLVPGHSLELCLWVLTIAVTGAVIALTGREYTPQPATFPQMLGELAGGLAILSLLPGLLKNSAVSMDGVHMALAVIAAAALIFSAFRMFRGQVPSMFLHSGVCVFFALHLISRYRVWSSHPQIQDYFFPLMAALAGMVFAYLRCDRPRVRLRRIAGLLGAFSAFAAAGGGDFPVFFLGTGLWMLLTADAPGDTL